MTTVWIYVDTNYYIGHRDHLKVLASSDAANEWFKDNDPEGVAFEYPVIGADGNELDRAPNHPCNAVDRGVADHLEFVASIISPARSRLRGLD